MGSAQPDESAVCSVLRALQPPDSGERRWAIFLRELAERAANGPVSVYDVALAAWQHDEERIRRVIAEVEVPLATLTALLTAGVREKALDAPPPVLERGPARYAVVIRTDTATDDSNRYATFEDAQFALAYLASRFFGTQRPAAMPGRPVSVVIRERVGQPRAIFIRELL
jgi:hypothetical protein